MMKLDEIKLNEAATFQGLDLEPIVEFEAWYSENDLWDPEFPDYFSDCFSQYFPNEHIDTHTLGIVVADYSHSFYGNRMAELVLYAKKNPPPDVDNGGDDENVLAKWFEEHNDDEAKFDHDAFDKAFEKASAAYALKKMVKDTDNPALQKRLQDRIDKKNNKS